MGTSPPPVPRPPGSRPPVPADTLTEGFDPARLPAGEEAPPRTGQPEVDWALDGVVGLGDEPLSAHPDRLARAHEALHAQLQDPGQDSGAG